MWELLPKKLQLTAIFVAGMLGVKAYDATTSYVTQQAVSFWSEVSFATLFVGTILYLLTAWLWRPIWQHAPYLRQRMFPYLHGTWKGTLHSTWVNPATGQTVAPIPATFKIRQGLFVTSVTMTSGESGSHSTNLVLQAYPERDCFRIWYGYANGPKQVYRHRSAPHDGVAYLEFDASGKADRLTGRYFTERQTSGDIEIGRISLEVDED